MPQETIEGTEPLIRMTVAAGRSVQTHNGYKVEYDQIMVAGQPSLVSRQIPIEGQGFFTEGEEVELPVSEATRLKDLGYLVAPGEPQSRPLGITAETLGQTPGKIGRVELGADHVGLLSKQVY